MISFLPVGSVAEFHSVVSTEASATLLIVAPTAEKRGLAVHCE